MVTLNEMFVGYNDGKTEARRRPNFEQSYFDYNGNVDTILSDECYLLLGKKGTGKSILAEYIKKKSEEDSNWFCTISSYKDFNFHELVHLKNNDIKPNEYKAIWEWLILIELAKQCIEDTSNKTIYKENLEKFITNNFLDLKITMKKVVEITKKASIKGMFLSLVKIGGEIGQDKKYQYGSYLDYLEDLKENVLKCLKESDKKFTIIFDELDDKFRNEDLYKSNIISLIKIVDKYNSYFFENEINTKIILLLRTDIFYVLNDSDLNKIEEDSSVKLEWGNNISSDSPLFDMVLNKIKSTVPEFQNLDRTELFNLLFPEEIKYRKANEFILGRTYFRPRDLVTYLNKIRKKDGTLTNFSANEFIATEKSYSEYLYKEVKNELYGHLSDIKINEGFLLLKQFKKAEFNYHEIKEYYENRTQLYKNIDLEEILKFFFDFSVLGNKQYNDAQKKYFYSWAYRENIEVDFDKKFTIHLGLRKELNL